MEYKITRIKKRNGQVVDFDAEKIKNAVHKALVASGQGNGETSEKVTEKIVGVVNRRFKLNEMPEVEQIQDIVEEILILEGFVETARSYILYREQRRTPWRSKSWI